ncbi:unknown [Firmicutes bacterium CAG:94]|nr:unknown [Firmicutes bacterium CAG:94]
MVSRDRVNASLSRISPPIISGLRKMHHRLIMVICSSWVNLVQVLSSEKPCKCSRRRPRGSMSQSGQQPGDTWRSHTSQRQNISSSSSHWSQKSSVMRHMLAFCRRCQALSMTAGPGDRDSTMGLPHLSMALRIISISFSPE